MATAAAIWTTQKAALHVAVTTARANALEWNATLSLTPVADVVPPRTCSARIDKTATVAYSRI
jgi:hypothetical protein